MTTRSYSELITLNTFEERFRYLQLRGGVADSTFGHERWMNQQFYRSREWRQIRQHVIARDEGCDLALPGYEIFETIYIHHMNPMSADDIRHGAESMLDLENLISTTHRTHNAIHYGDESLLRQPYMERRPGDTKLW